MEYFDGDEKKIVIQKPSLIYPIIKRTFDIVMSLLALLCLSPVFLGVWMMNTICRSNRGPLFYRQTRVGLNGKKFGMYKFRSMVVNAEEKLYQDKKLYAKYVANNYKLKPEDDPRVTCIGRVLRKSSIDEIPQFINILKGHMSLVGPRPVIEAELKEYDQDKLLSVKPGAMGLWQASGRSHIGYPERAQIEMRYIDQACMLFDIKIIIGNFISVFKGKGAY
ncbi:sugar transferase [Companilactobacillus nantensis]|uniref:Galactosyltransferase n=1 Tax=Companilactobacillus nantensis DSM 16982 TaxID=1423774 RepID=A0A0R1WH37_9LACO|nr:sugar transferase [Companilactobacillus nantensis]KRM17168.1 galactosyltransferase [Companilactobacillus nantensis DSM 16982]GEO64105.1 exopolysaccharide biosynthesis protein [Companilactobacillus nantensis]